MPRCLEPGATFEVVLDDDADKPVPPTFVFRSLSVREWKNAAASGGLDAAIASVKLGLVGWKNMKRDGKEIPFDREELDAVVDELEVVELLRKVRFNPTDKKKLESQHTFGPANSAPAASVGSAITPPPPESE
jgi:hypothetical protein